MHLAHLAMAAFLFAHPSSARPVNEPWSTLLSIPWPYWNKVTADYTTVAAKQETKTPTNLPRDGLIPDSYTVDSTAYSYNPWTHPIRGVVTTGVPSVHAEADAEHLTPTKFPRDDLWPESYTASGTVYSFDIHTHTIRDAIPTNALDADFEVYINTDYIIYDIPLHATITKLGEVVTVDNFFTLGGTIYPWIPFTNAIRNVVPTNIPEGEAYADVGTDASPSEPIFAEAKPTPEAKAEEAPSDETTTQTSKFFPEIVLVSPSASSTRKNTLPSDFFEVHSTSTGSAKSVITPIDLTQETVITPIEPWWTTSSNDPVGTTLVKVVVTHADYYDEEPATTSAPSTSSVLTDIGTWTKTVPV